MVIECGIASPIMRPMIPRQVKLNVIVSPANTVHKMASDQGPEQVEPIDYALE
jgi:hypothetical protein